MSAWYVIYSKTKGIFLGKGCWSSVDNGRGIDRAPCYGHKSGAFMMHCLSVVMPEESLQLHPVFPDILSESNLYYATERACVNAGFKWWNPEAFKAESN